jgi:hypothetical protein
MLARFPSVESIDDGAIHSLKVRNSRCCAMWMNFSVTSDAAVEHTCSGATPLSSRPCILSPKDGPDALGLLFNHDDLAVLGRISERSDAADPQALALSSALPCSPTDCPKSGFPIRSTRPPSSASSASRRRRRRPRSGSSSRRCAGIAFAVVMRGVSDAAAEWGASQTSRVTDIARASQQEFVDGEVFLDGLITGRG